MKALRSAGCREVLLGRSAEVEEAGGKVHTGDEEAVAALRHPRLCGIDLNSRFETAPGLKDVSLLRPFIGRLRSAWRQRMDN